MILSVWSWLAELFAPLAEYIFLCIVCGLRRLLRARSAEEAKQAIQAEGWRGPKKAGDPPGWRCTHCAGD